MNVNTAGNYQITNLTDANCAGTSFTGNPIISVNSLPTSSITSANTGICPGSNTDISITFTGTAPYNFSYTDGTNSFSKTANSSPYNLNVNTAGNYQITNLTDANCAGASFTGNTIITENTLPTASIISEDVKICTGTSTDIAMKFTGTAPFNFDYTDGTNSFSQTANSNLYNLNVNTAGNYKITSLTDANCTGTSFTGNTVTAYASNVGGEIITDNSILCSGNKVNLKLQDYSGNIRWEESETGTNWITAGNAFSATYTSPKLTASTYFRAVLSNEYCKDEFSNTLLITINKNPEIGNLSAEKNEICENEIFKLSSENHLGTIQWQQSGDMTSWVDIVDANSDNYTNSLFQSTYFRTAVSVSECGAKYSEIIYIKVNSAPKGKGNITGLEYVQAGDPKILYDISSITGADNYLWILNDTWQTVESENNTIFIGFPEDAASGILKVIGQNQCGISDTAKLFINIKTTDIQELSEAGFKIYPNPSTGIFMVASQKEIDEMAIIIKDITGKEIYKTRDKNVNKSSINLSGKAAGVYFIQIRYDNKILNGRLILR